IASLAAVSSASEPTSRKAAARARVAPLRPSPAQRTGPRTSSPTAAPISPGKRRPTRTARLYPFRSDPSGPPKHAGRPMAAGAAAGGGEPARVQADDVHSRVAPAGLPRGTPADERRRGARLRQARLSPPLLRHLALLGSLRAERQDHVGAEVVRARLRRVPA